MKKCIDCGKWALFTKLDKASRCLKCKQVFLNELRCLQERDEYNRKKRLEEKKRSEAYTKYDNLLSMYKNLKVQVESASDPIERLDQLPVLMEYISLCDVFHSELTNLSKMFGFSDIIEEKMVNEGEGSSYLQYASFPDYGIRFTYRRNNKSDVLQSFVCELEKETVSLKKHYEHLIYVINHSAEYTRMLRSIPSVVINPNSITPQLPVGDIGDVKYSRITSKSNYFKIGTFVSIDVETTGLNAGRSELIEVAAIRFEAWQPVAKIESLIKPRKQISDEITKLTGITNDMLKDAPTFSSIIPSLEEFIGDSNIVGYNLPFDLKFLYKYGYDFTTKKRKYFDVLGIVRSFLKKPKRKWDKEAESYEIDYESYFDVYDYKLTTVSKYYQIREESDAHRAASDALATGIVFMHVAREKIPENI